jgi:hypothetical protein
MDTKAGASSLLPRQQAGLSVAQSPARASVAVSSAQLSPVAAPPAATFATTPPDLIRTLTSRQAEAADAFYSSGVPGLSFGVTPSVFATYPPGDMHLSLW